ncbi:hypothetical protein F5Y01DRAFT_315800 [Xylaria sp. FL0043]|nr:hypothetical protein F5Y01DRAFT_315800 [Xylaria sp. FL0043]
MAEAELRSLEQIWDTYVRFLGQKHMTLCRLPRYITEADTSATCADLPLSFVIDILPAMEPRTYATSSSPAVSPPRVSITVSMNLTVSAVRLSNRRNGLSELDRAAKHLRPGAHFRG